MNHSKFAIGITITCIVLILALIGGTWSPVSAANPAGTVPKGGGGGPKGDNAGCPVEGSCIIINGVQYINGVPVIGGIYGLPVTGAAPLQAELPWALVLIPLIIASLGAFTYGFSMRRHHQADQARS